MIFEVKLLTTLSLVEGEWLPEGVGYFPMAYQEITFARVLWEGRRGSKILRLRELDMGRSKVGSLKLGAYISFPGTVPLYVSCFRAMLYQLVNRTKF